MNCCGHLCATFVILLLCGYGLSTILKTTPCENRNDLSVQDSDYDLNQVDYGALLLQDAFDDVMAPIDIFGDSSIKEIRREKRHTKKRRGPKIWDQWGKWSACSVTCGVGKIVRWRHCVAGGCASGEKEAQIKSCTLPAC